MAPQAIMGDYFGDCHRIGGAVQWTLTGFATVIFITTISLMQRGVTHIFGNSTYYRHLPLIDIDEQTIGRQVPWYGDWCSHTVYDDYWKALDTEARLQDVHVPVIQQAAWYDPYTASMLRTWGKLHQRRSDQKIYNNSTWTWMKFAAEAIYPGPIDQRRLERRDDVLVYTSPRLDADLEVTGPLEMVLYASSSARDTDFTAKLVDVFSRASIAISTPVRICLRARGRRSPTRPCCTTSVTRRTL
jgi:predicted acyl esterase